MAGNLLRESCHSKQTIMRVTFDASFIIKTLEAETPADVRLLLGIMETGFKKENKEPKVAKGQKAKRVQKRKVKNAIICPICTKPVKYIRSHYTHVHPESVAPEIV